MISAFIYAYAYAKRLCEALMQIIHEEYLRKYPRTSYLRAVLSDVI